MSHNRVTGLASAFDAPPPVQRAPSAVSALASRFDAPPSTSDEPKVSDRLSGIASRFGATVADAPPARLGMPVSKKPAVKQAASPPSVKADVETAKTDFSAISKRFASGRANERDEKAGVVEMPKMFSAAKDAFEKREEAARPPIEGKVSQFRSRIEKGRMEGGEKGKEEKRKGTEEKGTEESGEQMESLSSRFQNATKMFGGSE